MTRDDRADGDDSEARERLADEELTLAANEEILHAVGELVPVLEHERTYFVLGNYDRLPMRRLTLVADRLNRRPDAYAFRMVDVRGDFEDGVFKFRLLADLVTHVVGVAEADPSGFLVEQGLLVGVEEYFEKTHCLKREYDGEGGDAFDWMQLSVFDRLEREGRLYRWRTEEELATVVEEVP